VRAAGWLWQASPSHAPGNATTRPDDQTQHAEDAQFARNNDDDIDAITRHVNNE